MKSRIEIDYICDASSQQVQYWNYHNELDKDQTHQLIKIETSIEYLDMNAIENSVETMVRRHDSLRTFFSIFDGEIKQCVVPYDKAIFSPFYYDISSLENYEEAVKERVEECKRMLQKVDTPPLMRICILKISEKDCYLCLFVHHIISDEWSAEVIYRELVSLYDSFKEGKPIVVPPLKIQLRDYAFWQKKWVEENGETIRSFWVNKFGKFSEREGEISDTEGMRGILDKGKGVSFFGHTDPKQYEQLIELASFCNSSIWAVINAGFQLLFFLLKGKERILIAMPIAYRFLPGSENLIGCLGGGIYLYEPLDRNMTVKELVTSVFRNFIESAEHVIFDHREMGLEYPELRMDCDIFANFISSEVNGGRMLPAYKSGAHYDLESPGYYALACIASEYQNGLLFNWKYNIGLYSPQAIEFIASRYQRLLWEMHAYPEMKVKNIIEAVM